MNEILGYLVIIALLVTIESKQILLRSFEKDIYTVLRIIVT